MPRTATVSSRRPFVDPWDEGQTWVVHAILAAAIAAIVLPLVVAMHRGSVRPASAPATAVASFEPTLALVLIGDAGSRR